MHGLHGAPSRGHLGNEPQIFRWAMVAHRNICGHPTMYLAPEFVTLSEKKYKLQAFLTAFILFLAVLISELFQIKNYK